MLLLLLLVPMVEDNDRGANRDRRCPNENTDVGRIFDDDDVVVQVVGVCCRVKEAISKKPRKPVVYLSISNTIQETLRAVDVIIQCWGQTSVVGTIKCSLFALCHHGGWSEDIVSTQKRKNAKFVVTPKRSSAVRN